MSVLERLTRRLVVSCQADPGTPLDAPEHIVALAACAVNGGAAGLRLEGALNIAAVRSVTAVPLIGLIKTDGASSAVYITPTLDDARAVIDAGADIVAVDATHRDRPVPLVELVRAVKEHGRALMGDVSTLDEARTALGLGADIVSTTLSGYTVPGQSPTEPDFELMHALGQASLPFVAEGRIWSPEQAAHALELGASFVVVGSAITRPMEITQRFHAAVTHAAARPQERRA